MRSAWKLLLVLGLVAFGALAPATAGVQKVIFADEFGYAT